MSPKRRKSRPIGETIGGIIVGFDQQILRTTPPAQELVQKGSPIRGVTGEDGSDLEIVFPDDVRPGPGKAPEPVDPREPDGEEDD